MHDLPVLLLERVGYKAEPGVAIPDSRVLQTPESTANAGYNRGKRRKETNIRAAFDALGRRPLALWVTKWTMSIKSG